MLSKNPLELTSKKFSKEELAQALRLSIIAELDAINLYIQIASAVDDEKIRKVFEDVAREEKTHVGEFLALLKIIDPEQVKELRKGSEEVKELTGTEPPE
ncbi:MAG: rubrerythrin [Desulfurococcales archaeon]|nr:rubrerythrin [Desulfurococcales archaeon]